jgi:hypothetical protein
MKSMRIAAVAWFAMLASGCAVGGQNAKSAITGSIKPRSEAPAKSAEDTRKAFCAQRHIDYHTGKTKTAEQKQADDRLCAALDRQG